ncbi:hypothetical protein [Roseobacter sinensis]|uniref:Uncharacterized protein n=1 Tax=Roseobacter sinensis TaxID=2931391 RepID=A0ABT3BM94_9RHOB|nr:hypothetical protein [Roseobacter sp. WL0113]MCV3274409.1 hypothetical protein [Roseobacter sp. WL0113]
MTPWYENCKNSFAHAPKSTALAFLSALLLQHPAAGSDEDVCTLFHSETDMVSQTLYMHQEDVSHELVFPLVYFEDVWDRRDDQIHEAQLFSVMINDFSPIYRPDTAELLKTRPAPFMTFVIHDLVELDRLVEIVLSGAAPHAKHGLSGFQRVPTEVGLYRLEPLGEQTMYRDVFVNFDEKDAVQGVISCRQPGDVLNPSCNHDFRTADIDVRVNYAREYLPEWSAIQGKISRFLSCATGKPDVRTKK